MTDLPLVKPILGTAVGLQSLALVGVAAKTVPKDFLSFKPGKKSKPMNFKKQTGNFIKGSMGLMVGIPFVGATSKMVNEL